MSDFFYIFGLLFGIMAAEVFLDNIMWKSGLNDKPLSTILRGIALIAAALLNDFYIGLGSWYTTLFLGLSIYFLFFNYLINMTLKRKFFYLGTGWFDRQLAKLPGWPRLWLQIWIFITAITIYIYFNE